MAKVKQPAPPLDVEAELRLDNKSARGVDLKIFADALTAYVNASDNINANGTIVSHPRTGAPIENPYLKIAKHAGEVLTKMRTIKADRVLEKVRVATAARRAEEAANAATLQPLGMRNCLDN